MICVCVFGDLYKEIGDGSLYLGDLFMNLVILNIGVCGGNDFHLNSSDLV